MSFFAAVLTVVYMYYRTNAVVGEVPIPVNGIITVNLFLFRIMLLYRKKTSHASVLSNKQRTTTAWSVYCVVGFLYTAGVLCSGSGFKEFNVAWTTVGWAQYHYSYTGLTVVHWVHCEETCYCRDGLRVFQPLIRLVHRLLCSPLTRRLPCARHAVRPSPPPACKQ